MVVRLKVCMEGGYLRAESFCYTLLLVTVHQCVRYQPSGDGQRQPDGQPLHGLAVGQRLGQHHGAGQTDKLPWHHHFL